jgi:hypothetical protein
MGAPKGNCNACKGGSHSVSKSKKTYKMPYWMKRRLSKERQKQNFWLKAGRRFKSVS